MPSKRTKARQAPAAAISLVPGTVHGGLRVTVTFAQAHTHRGVDFGKGDRYEATPAERELLAYFGVLERD